MNVSSHRIWTDDSLFYLFTSKPKGKQKYVLKYTSWLKKGPINVVGQWTDRWIPRNEKQKKRHANYYIHKHMMQANLAAVILPPH